MVTDGERVRFVPQPGDVRGWDRYAYVENNPLRYADPSGHCKTLSGKVFANLPPPGDSGPCPEVIIIDGWDDSYQQSQDSNTCAWHIMDIRF